MNINYLILARVMSLHSNFKIHMGAVIVRRGTPLAVGWNETRSHPRLCNKLQTTVHAEISALATVPKVDLRGSVIYVYREHRDGTSALARPCANCWLMLKMRGVKWVIYTTDHYPFFQQERIT